MTTPSVLTRPRVKDYSHIEPLPDPPREPDMQQNKVLVPAESALIAYYKPRGNVVICGQGYLIADVGDPVQFSPDCIFADEANPDSIDDLNGYIISVVGKPPDFVLEVASHSTSVRDYTVKRDGYAALGVREYWRFDRTGGRYHDAPLAGDMLVDGKYEPIEIVHEPDGRHWGYSDALGLELWWDDRELRFRDPETGRYLPTPGEFGDALEDAESRAVQERVARLDAERRVFQERDARRAVEVELRRLRERLEQGRE